METTDIAPPMVVCDAGPVIHLDELGCLDLLHDFPDLIVSVAVRREIQHHRAAAKRKYGYHVLPILHDGRLVGRLDPKLHRNRSLLEIRALQVEGWTAPYGMAYRCRGPTGAAADRSEALGG